MLRRLGITLLTIVVLAALVAFELGVFMLATINLVNTVQFPLWDNRDFVFVLFRSNFVQGLVEAFNQPVMILGHKASSVTDFTAALFYYPLAVLVHLALAFAIAVYLFRRPYRRPLAFATGVLLLLVVTNGVWLASCCGSSPGWLLDTALRYYVFAADGNPVERLQTYEVLLPYLLPLQVFFATVGTVLVLRPLLGRR